jgi:hypothetical protein
MRLHRRVAQLGSATGLGPVGRRFESSLADHPISFRTLDLSFLNLSCYPIAISLYLAITRAQHGMASQH